MRGLTSQNSLWCTRTLQSFNGPHPNLIGILYHLSTGLKLRSIYRTVYVQTDVNIIISEIKKKLNYSNFITLLYSQTCIKRSPLGQRKSGLIRQVTSLKRFNSYEIFYDRTRKRWPFNAGDCLIEVISWADFTVITICVLLDQQYYFRRGHI